MRSLARWGTLPLAAWPLGSWALGLGEIETLSYLNQPLNAEIALSATPEELSGLNVSMAPVSAFTSRGLEYPALLNSIDFSVGRDASGQNVIRLRSREAIAEPFVTLVVQVTSGRSGFTREYSVLLDPPLFLPAETAPEPIAAPATREPSPAVAGGAIQRPAAPAAPAPRPAEPPVAAPASPPAAAAPVATDGQYTVRSGDTLWRIAQGNRPAGVSTNQAMLAIYDANPGAFDGNINLLRRGAILRIPPVADFSSVAAATATAEVSRQMDAWRAGVETAPRVTLLPPSEDDVATGAALGGADSAAVSALESEVSDLQGELAATREQLAEAQRLLELRSAELADLQNVATQAPAADEAEPVAEGADAAAADAVTAEEPVFVDEPVADDQPAADEAAPAPRSTLPSVSTADADTGPSLVDTILGTIMKPVVLIGAGIGILLIGALAFLRRRRGDEEDVTGQWEALEAEIEEEVDHAATARLRARAGEADMVVVEGHEGDATEEESKLSGTAEIEALGALSGEFSDFDDGTSELDALTMPDDDQPSLGAIETEPSKADQTLSSHTVINLDQADPIAEADFHMAYGLYDQAADLVTKALEADPDNRAYKLKLLEVFFVWGNKEQFLQSAQALKSEIGEGGNADWDKVVIMGKQICPDEPLFSEATAAAGEIDLDLESSGELGGLDLAFAGDSSDAVDLDFGTDEDAELSLEESGEEEVQPERSQADTLDIGERTQAGLEAALFEDVDADGERTTPGGQSELSDFESTMESPTVETPYGSSEDDSDAVAFESGPTVETEGVDSPTDETPTIETPAAGDAGDTVEQQGPSTAAAEMTAEIELDDLGLDVGDLEDLPAGDGDDSLDLNLTEDDDLTVGEPAGEDESTLSATGVTQVLHREDDGLEHTGTAVLSDDDATMMAPGTDAEPTGIQTAVLEQSTADFEAEQPQTEDDLDLNLDDFSNALGSGADTIEQPMASGFGDVDLDVGFDFETDDDSPTGTEEMGSLDPQTMTEVGTKLDLARAYIDMGDPDGAKSILEEVLNEGDSGQRSEAQALIDASPA